MKGIELPINVLIIVVVAVIVLLGIIAVYFTGWFPFAQTAGVDAVKNAGCRMVIYDCDKDLSTIVFDGSMAGLPTFDVTGEGTYDYNDNLAELCRIYYEADETKCAEICGCPSTSGGGGGTPFICTSDTSCCRNIGGGPCGPDTNPQCIDGKCSCSGGTQSCPPNI